MAQNDKLNKKYGVWIDDNYHAMMEPNTYHKYFEFDNKEDALKKCEELLIESLSNQYKEGSSFGDTVASWAMFGEDPFIRSDDCEFSARKFIETKRDDEDYFKKIRNFKNAK